MSDFENYLKQAKLDFCMVLEKYTLCEHLELQTAADSFIIAFDQAVASIKKT